MKQFYCIGGPMGVGKTEVSKLLNEKLPNSVWLDGDWCWEMSPFQVTEETKTMVVENICFLLNQFFRCPAFKNVVFSWVLDSQALLDDIFSRLETSDYQLYVFSLVAREETLKAHLERDIFVGKRQVDIVKRSVARLPNYADVCSEKIDVSMLTPTQVAEELIKRVTQSGK